MSPKPHTPIKNVPKPASSRYVSKPVTKDNLIAVLKSFKVEVLSSSKALSELQANQYNDL